MDKLNLSQKTHIAAWLISFKSVAKVKEMYEEKYKKEAPATSSMYFLNDLFLETGSVVGHRP